MFDDIDTHGKTDGELLEMWAEQNELVDGLVGRVRAEIRRRSLDTSAVNIRTIDKVNRGTTPVERASPQSKISGKLPRILIATVVGLASGAVLFFIGMGLVWGGNSQFVRNRCVCFRCAVVGSSSVNCGSSWFVDISKAFQTTPGMNLF